MGKYCSSRWFYGSELLIIIGLLVFAYSLQWYKGLPPCVLCEMQRLVFAGLGLFFLLGTVISLKRCAQMGLNFFILVLALFGMMLAGRQVWLQYHPLQVGGSNCDASLYYLLHIMSWQDVLATAFIGGPECAKINWQFLSFSIPQ